MDEVGFPDVFRFGVCVLSPHGSRQSGCWTVGNLQDVTGILKTLEVPVLHKRLRGITYHGWTLGIRVRDGVANVDNLVVRVQRE